MLSAPNPSTTLADESSSKGRGLGILLTTARVMESRRKFQVTLEHIERTYARELQLSVGEMRASEHVGCCVRM